MRRLLLAAVALLTLATNAFAWNNKGHMVVARMAWLELKPEERAKIIAILKKHPHYDAFLRAKRPDNFQEDEWVFLRAATWADWVKSGPEERRKYSDGPAHYVNLPFVSAGSKVTPPELPKDNVINKLTEQIAAAKGGGSGENVAVSVTWVMHLAGDIHQPLHCFTLYNDDFPTGDKGGNKAEVKIGTRTIHLHPFWDGLFGTSTSLSSIGRSVHEIEALLKDKPDLIKDDLAANKTPESWAKESFEVAKRVGYVNGTLHPANEDNNPADSVIPKVPTTYPQDAGKAARIRVAMAGKRLARLLRDIAAAN